MTTKKQINGKLAWTANVARKLFTAGNVTIMNAYVAATVRYFACPKLCQAKSPSKKSTRSSTVSHARFSTSHTR